MLLQKPLDIRNSDLIIKLLKIVFEKQLNNIRLNNYVNTNMPTLYFVNSFSTAVKPFTEIFLPTLHVSTSI